MVWLLRPKYAVLLIFRLIADTPGFEGVAWLERQILLVLYILFTIVILVLSARLLLQRRRVEFVDQGMPQVEEAASRAERLLREVIPCQI